MEIESEQLDGSILKINLSGRMDVAGSQRIDGPLAELTSRAGAAIIIDLSKVAFVASIGIRSLLVAARAVRNRGGRMVLLNPEPNVARVLEMAGVDMTIGVYRDLKAACAAVAAPSGNA